MPEPPAVRHVFRHDKSKRLSAWWQTAVLTYGCQRWLHHTDFTHFVALALDVDA